MKSPSPFRLYIDRRSRFLFVALAFCVLPTPASAQAEVHWELVNPFRFIHDRESVEKIREIYGSLTVKSALELERRLQRTDEDRIDAMRVERMTACRAGGQTEAECIKKFWYPYLGWFAGVARNAHAKTCWDSSALSLRESGPCVDYIHPKTHRVRAWIENDEASEPSGLRWLAGGAKPDAPGSCGANFGKRVCLEFDLPYNGDTKAPGVSVEVWATDGLVGRTPDAIKVKDILIAGLGDSFASGEGNPDIPAQFMTNQSDRDFFYFWKWRRFPRKDKIDPTSELPRRPDVAWLDRRCHRSMYSYQFKAALRYALDHPQRAVTFLSYSCSGGTTANIYLKGSEQSAQEGMPRDSRYHLNGGRGKIALQLTALRDALKGRAVDILLLSSGGNDIGFSRYVAYVVTSGKTRWLIAKTPKTERIRKEITEIGTSYRELQDAIFDAGINIRGCGKAGSCNRIVLTPYPNVFTDESGQKICDVTRHEFTMPFNRDPGRSERAKKLLQMLFEPLDKFQTAVPATHGWSIADSTRDRWKGHGFCAQQTPLPTYLEERFIMPQRRNWVWKAYRPEKDNRERDLGTYEPWNYNAYASRARWIRLPIDSKLTADQQRRIWKISIDFLFEDDRSSVMHPTAEGHANNADANYDVMRALLD